MKSKTDIHKFNLLYSSLKIVVDTVFLMSYQRKQYIGLEKIPKDGAIIFAPNHTNGLQDALAILALNSKPKVFVARADIFKKPTLKKFLTFCKMMPILRMRDGMNNLGQNEEIMEKACEVLVNKVPFCIMAEGRHRPQHSLLPLLKGIFRIAIMADKEIDGNIPVYIVPVGIEYGSYYRFRTSMLVNIGKPLNLSQIRKEHSELSEPELINVLREDLSQKMQDTILCIPDNDNYEAVLELCYILSEDRLRKDYNVRNTLYNRMKEDKKVVAEVQELINNDPEKWMDIKSKVLECREIRTKENISAYSIARSWLWTSLILKALLIIVGFPFWIFALITASPVLLGTHLLGKKLKDKSFLNSFRFGASFFIYPFILAIWGAVFFTLIPNLWIAAGLFALSFSSIIISHDYYKAARHLKSDISLAFNKRLKYIIKFVRESFN